MIHFVLISFILSGYHNLQSKNVKSLMEAFEQGEQKDKPRIALEIGKNYSSEFFMSQEFYMLSGIEIAQLQNDKSSEIELLF
jgi:hypothetical protein